MFQFQRIFLSNETSSFGENLTSRVKTCWAQQDGNRGLSLGLPRY